MYEYSLCETTLIEGGVYYDCIIISDGDGDGQSISQ